MPGSDRTIDPGRPLPTEDLDHVARLAHDAMRDLDGSRILITGSSGFLGSWMTETLCWASENFDIRLHAKVLLRTPRRFGEAFPHLAVHPAVEICSGDVLTAALDDVDFTHVIHAAAPVQQRNSSDSSFDDFDAIVLGSRRLLKLSMEHCATRFLFLSSGAVYGQQPPDIPYIGEDFRGGPETMNPDSVYGEAKRAAELMCALANRNSKLDAVVARGFTFVGPRLPLNSCYAAGNFVADRIAQRPIRVEGDGTPWRSYMYAADAAVWLWTMLARGSAGQAYNVGSDEACTIGQLAHEVAVIEKPAIPVTIRKEASPTAPASRYIPSIRKASSQLGLAIHIDRHEALLRTVRFHTG